LSNFYFIFAQLLTWESLANLKYRIAIVRQSFSFFLEPSEDDAMSLEEKDVTEMSSSLQSEKVRSCYRQMQLLVLDSARFSFAS